MKRDIFPKTPVSFFKTVSTNYSLIQLLRQEKKLSLKNIGNLINFPNLITSLSWSSLLPYNPGNLGNWSQKFQKNLTSTKLLERNVIRQIISLYSSTFRNFEGYFTSGSTEGNIFSAWAGRNWLIKKLSPSAPICLIKTSLSHYSITKAADIINIKTFNCSLDEKWGLDYQSLKVKLEKLYQKKYRGFLLPISLGYTLTGTDDNLEQIISVIRTFHQEHPNSQFFCWIDAALSGLVLPFIQNNFQPFKYPEIQSLTTDFHKAWGLPIPSSIIIYRQHLRQYIEKNIDYLEEKDNTLLGSRSGIPPVVCWNYIATNGKNGIQKNIRRNLISKNNFIKSLSKFPNITIVSSPTSLQAGIIISDNNPSTIKFLTSQYHLYFRQVKTIQNNRSKTITIAKSYFLHYEFA